MPFILSLFRFVFYLLYHQFAWAYDIVAAVVSLGYWNDWVRTALPYLDGRVLELGFGPGHLQLALHQKGLLPCGLDESRQMVHQAARRLTKSRCTPRLSRGCAQVLPYQTKAFDTVVATFPAEYILDPLTLKEIGRVLVQGGKLVVVSMAWITGVSPLERLAAWLFRVTGETEGLEKIWFRVETHFKETGFQARYEIVEVGKSRALVVIANRQ
jgi:ubiquinone/menaquinone biosynthesis C-methylase UbiE